MMRSIQCHAACVALVENISKLERAKTFAKMFVQQMKAEDYFGIVTFGTTAKVASPLVIMNDENKVRKRWCEDRVGGIFRARSSPLGRNQSTPVQT